MAVLTVLWHILLWIFAVLGALLALLLLLLCVPIYLSFTHRAEQTEMKIRLFGIPIRLLPTKPKDSEKKKTEPKKKPKTVQKKENPFAALHKQWKQDGAGALIRTYLSLAKLAVQAVGKLLYAPIVDRLYVRMSVAGKEPDQTAIQYGRVCSLIYPAQAVLENKMRFRKTQVEITPDFIGSKNQVEVQLRAHVYPIRVAVIALWMIFCFVTKLNTKTQEEKADGK